MARKEAGELNGVKKPITRRLKLSFIWSFWVSLLSFVGLMIDGISTSYHSGITPIDAILCILMVVSGPVWYISLGKIAHRLGRSWIAWVGLSFIFSPLAPLIIFPLILGHIRAATK